MRKHTWIQTALFAAAFLSLSIFNASLVLAGSEMATPQITGLIAISGIAGFDFLSQFDLDQNYTGSMNDRALVISVDQVLSANSKISVSVDGLNADFFIDYDSDQIIAFPSLASSSTAAVKVTIDGAGSPLAMVGFFDTTKLGVITPKLGEVWEIGNTYEVAWRGNDAYFLMFTKSRNIVKNDSSTYEYSENLYGEASPASFTVPDFFEPGNDYQAVVAYLSPLITASSSQLLSAHYAVSPVFSITGQTSQTVPPPPPYTYDSEAHPEGTLINQDGTIYRIGYQSKIGFPSASVFHSQGHEFSEVVPANSADRDLPVSGFETYRDGDLIMDGRTVYIIYAGTKVGFETKEAFEGQGYSWSNVFSGDLSSYPLAGTISDPLQAHSFGTLVQIGSTVYRTFPGGKFGISTPVVFRSHKFRWNRIVPGNAADMEMFVYSNLDFQIGTLVNLNGTVYYLASEGRRRFNSSEDFLNMGYRFENVIVVTNEDMSAWPEAAAMRSSSPTVSNDSKRFADIRQIMTALELFYNDNNRYPTAMSGQPLQTDGMPAWNTYLPVFPAAPVPPEGTCTVSQNAYEYTQLANGSSYVLIFCLGSATGGYGAGVHTAGPYGIL